MMMMVIMMMKMCNAMHYMKYRIQYVFRKKFLYCMVLKLMEFLPGAKSTVPNSNDSLSVYCLYVRLGITYLC